MWSLALTSSDLLEGYNGLPQPMLVDPTEAIGFKQLDYLLVEDLCYSSNLPISYLNGCCDLEINERSRYSYGTKVLVRTIICDIEKEVIVKSH